MSCCGGNCGSCSGCSRALELTEKEMDFLMDLVQVAFLPVARTADSPDPIYPEVEGMDRAIYSLLIQCLEKKGLISLDYSAPLKGCRNPAYESFPFRGSIGLTERGLSVVEMMDLQGFSQ